VFHRIADYYDVIYEAKNYDQESTFVSDVVAMFATIPVHDVLDLGCGTGGHLLRMTRMGWRPTGVDLSERMLDISRRKLQAAGFEVPLVQADLRSFDLGTKFDLITCLFSSFGYVTENSGVRSALEHVRRHLKIGGLFVMEFWNGAAVLSQRPEARVYRYKRDGLTVIRTAQPSLDTINHTATIRYDILAVRGSEVVDQLTEEHVVRFFFPQELAFHLEIAGMETLGFHAFPELGRPPSEADWAAAVVARPV
jgi:SAM-dependent methyltransferase